MEKLDVYIKKEFKIPQDFNLVKLWKLISPLVIEQLAPDFLSIPNLMDTNAFEIGNIFIQTQQQVQYFLYLTNKLIN